MRGNAKIINSEQDAKAASLTDEQVIKMATMVIRHDDAVYPDDYDHQLEQGDVGFIEPVYRNETIVDQAVLSRFGVKL